MITSLCMKLDELSRIYRFLVLITLKIYSVERPGNSGILTQRYSLRDCNSVTVLHHVFCRLQYTRKRFLEFSRSDIVIKYFVLVRRITTAPDTLKAESELVWIKPLLTCCSIVRLEYPTTLLLLLLVLLLCATLQISISILV